MAIFGVQILSSLSSTPSLPRTLQTLDDFQSQYLAAVNGVQFAPPSLAAYAFDAVWTLAVALNSTGLPSLTSSGMGTTEVLSREELQRISFSGITVRLAGRVVTRLILCTKPDHKFPCMNNSVMLNIDCSPVIGQMY